MKFLADEDIAQSVIISLRHDGHDVLDIKTLDRELTDIELVRKSEKEGRKVITHDKDFLTLLESPDFKFKSIFLKVVPQTRKNMLLVSEFVVRNKVWLKMKRSAVVNLKVDKIIASWD